MHLLSPTVVLRFFVFKSSQVICDDGCRAKIANDLSATDAILSTISQSNMQNLTSVSLEKLLPSSKRDSDSLRINNLSLNLIWRKSVPNKQMQESASASAKESGSHLLRHEASNGG